MKSRITSLLLALFFLSLPSWADAFRPALLLTHADGSSVKYCLEKLPKLSFQDETLTVSYEGQDEIYGRASIASLVYVDDPQVPSGIGTVRPQDAPSVTFYDHAFTVHASESLPLAVYTLSGQSVWSTTSVAGSSTRLEYDGLTPGVYVLKCGSHAYKFVVR